MTETNTPNASEILANELAIEQAHVDKVYRNLETATASARNVQAESRAKFQTDRADWAREEDGTALFERDAFAYQAAKRLAILDAQHEGLVFGRLDFTNQEKRYVGRLGVRDADYEPLVLDWRAPAAEPFYRATAADPMAVVRRRVLRCRDDRVTGIEDDLLDDSSPTDLVVIGEGALMASLKRSRGVRMRDIVATIQAEQDEAIRAAYQGVTIISGGPGTGKTVVALHRAAFLLYTYRKRLEQGGVLVIGPTDLFPAVHRAGAARAWRGFGDPQIHGRPGHRRARLRQPTGGRRGRRPGQRQSAHGAGAAPGGAGTAGGRPDAVAGQRQGRNPDPGGSRAGHPSTRGAGFPQGEPRAPSRGAALSPRRFGESCPPTSLHCSTCPETSSTTWSPRRPVM